MPTSPSRHLLGALLVAGAVLTGGCELVSPVMTLDADGRLAAAHLEAAQGEVVLEREDATEDAVLGYLYLKDAISTGPDGSAHVRFPGGQLVEIGPDARFVLGEDKTGIVLEVARGLVLTRVAADAPAGGGSDVSLTIATPFGLTRVGNEASEVAIDVGEDDAKVNVLLGSVEFVSRNGQPQNLTAGEKIVLTAGELEITGRTPQGEAAPAARQLELEPIQVLISASTGKVELRRKDSKKWTAAKKGEQLAEGDSVRVREGRTTLGLGDGQSHLAIERESEVVLGRAGKAGEVQETQLDFKKGAVTLTLAPGQKSRVQLGELRLESDLGGQFGVQMTKDGYEVSAVAGDLRVSKGEVSQTVQAGQVATLDGGGAKVEAEDLAELLLPTKPGMKVFHPGLPQAAVTWDGPADATYFVEVALDATFTEKIIAGQVHRNALNVPPPRKGNLYWRISDAQGAKLDQGSAYFAPEPPLKDLGRLRNEVPEGSDTTTIYFQDKPPAVTFTYKPEANAAQYKLVVYRADDLAKPVTERTVAEVQVPLEAGALTEGDYAWSVTPLSESGEELRGGRMSRLEMVYDNSVPTLTVTSPKNGDKVAPTLRAAGVAPVGTKVWVNGKAVELDDKNRFDAEVSLGRASQVVFRVSKAGAPDAFTVRTLRRR